MKYLETKHEKRSALITTVIVLLLILVLFISGPKYLDPPDEYGVMVNFGTSSTGSGEIQPTEPVKSEPEKQQDTPEQEVAEPVETTSAPDQAQEQVLTQDTEEALAVKKAEEAKTQKEAAEAKEKARQEQLRKEQEAKKAEIDKMFGGLNKSDGKESGGEGDDNTAGDKGQIDGNPYANSYYGNGSGDNGKGYGLGGRGNASFQKIKPDCDAEGKVVVEIVVDRSGKVIKATPGKRGTVADRCLWDAARKTALTHKWAPDSKAPEKQIGFVVVKFEVGQ